MRKLIIMASVLTSMSACGGSQPELMTPVKFGELIETGKNISLIDVRTADEFQEGHIPGAINIDWNENGFEGKVKTAVPSENSLAIYCRSGRRSNEAARCLIADGYAVSDLEGGILDWQKAGLPLTTGQQDIYLTPGGSNVTIQPLIHASLRISFDNREIEIDPVGKLGNRTTDYSLFPKADLILVTHEHHDHLDPDAIKQLSKSDTVVITNHNSAEILGYGRVMANGDKISLGKNIEIEAVPAYNITPERLQFHPKGRDNGYVLTLDGLRIYIAGDTECIPEMKDLGDIDIAFLPCNLPYTMTPAQLIEAAETIRPKVLYPYHYGDTDLSSVTPALAPEGIFVRICPFD